MMIIYNHWRENILIYFFCILGISLLLSVNNHGVNGMSDPITLDSNSGFTLRWEVVDDINITFQGTINYKSWVAIGFHCKGCSSDAPMQNTDFVIMSFETDPPRVWDAFSNPSMSEGKKYYAPSNDTDIGGQYNIGFNQLYQSDDYTQFIFTRPLNTGDSACDHVIEKDQLLDLVWAHGKSNLFAAHGGGNSGRLTIDLSGHTQDPKLLNYHATFMTIAFAILLPFGMFTARYLKYFEWWFPLHIIVQVGAFIFSIVGFGLVIKSVGTLRLNTPHSIIGLITLILLVGAVVFGVLSHLFYDANRSKTPWFPDIIHWFGGRTVILLGIINIILGMVLYRVPNGVIIVYSIGILFYFIILIYLEYRNRSQLYYQSIGNKKKNDNQSEQQEVEMNSQ